MPKLSEENVVAVLMEQFKATNDTAFEFCQTVKERDRKEKEEAAPKDKVEKRFAVVIPDPKGELPKTLEKFSAYVIELLPTSVPENSLDYEDRGDLRELGENEIEDMMDLAVMDMRDNQPKKGPFESVHDIVNSISAKKLKTYGMKAIVKEPIAIIGVCPKTVYNGSQRKTDVNTKVAIVTRS